MKPTVPRARLVTEPLCPYNPSLYFVKIPYNPSLFITFYELFFATK